MLGVIATAIVAGAVLWDPAYLFLDIVEFLIAILIGANLETRLNRRAAADDWFWPLGDGREV